jgi:hypothetical protein
MLFAYVAYQIAQNDVLVEVFNPYAILQLSEGSSEDSIKKAYRKLTLIYHPDKETGSEQKFMELTEAYRVRQLEKCTQTCNDNVHSFSDTDRRGSPFELGSVRPSGRTEGRIVRYSSAFVDRGSGQLLYDSGCLRCCLNGSSTHSREYIKWNGPSPATNLSCY